MIFKLPLSKNVHILWIYLIVIHCRVNCFLVNVTRNKQDVFSYPSSFIGCHKICEERNSRSTVKNLHICRCKCERNHRTFVISKLKCVADSMLRNTEHGDRFFQLNETEYGNERLKVISINSCKTLIPFKVKLENNKKCVLNKIETLSQRSLKIWKSAKKGLKWKIIELDDDNIKKTYNWLPLKYEGWMLLSLQWRNKRRKYKGHIMRLSISCRRRKITLSGFLIFKVNGTITVSVNETLSLALSHSINPSTTSSVSSMSVFCSKPEDSLQFLPSSLIPSLSSMIPLSSQVSPLAPSMNILPPLVTTPLSRHNVTSSKLMTSHPLQHQNATMTNLLMKSSSSVVVFNRAKKSSFSVSKAVTSGIVVAGIIVLAVILFLLYLLKRRKLIFLRRTRSDLGRINPSYPSLSSVHIPALNNPLHDGVYENPDVLDDEKLRCKATAFDSAAYDACLMVDNPSDQVNKSREVKSFYDNIPNGFEDTYKALDPVKREPSAKYQSLIKRDNEYSLVSDSVSGYPAQEPLYDEVNMQHSDLNVAPRPPPLTFKKTLSSGTSQPSYNELENSQGVKKSGDDVQSSFPETEPIYNKFDNNKLLQNDETESPIASRKPSTGSAAEQGNNDLGNDNVVSIENEGGMVSSPSLGEPNKRDIMKNESFEKIEKNVKIDENNSMSRDTPTSFSQNVELTPEGLETADEVRTHFEKSEDDNISQTVPKATADDNISHTVPKATADDNISHTVSKATGDDDNISHTVLKATGDNDNLSYTVPKATGDDNISHTIPKATADDDNITHTVPKATGDNDNLSYTVPKATGDDNISHTIPKATADDDNISHTVPKATGDDNISLTIPKATADDDNLSYTVPKATDDDNISHTIPKATADDDNISHTVPKATDNDNIPLTVPKATDDDDDLSSIVLKATVVNNDNDVDSYCDKSAVDRGIDEETLTRPESAPSTDDFPDKLLKSNAHHISDDFLENEESCRENTDDGENRRDEEVKSLNTANDFITESRELGEESMNESECSTLQNI